MTSRPIDRESHPFTPARVTRVALPEREGPSAQCGTVALRRRADAACERGPPIREAPAGWSRPSDPGDGSRVDPSSSDVT